jgi:hypothetical protein
MNFALLFGDILMVNCFLLLASGGDLSKAQIYRTYIVWNGSRAIIIFPTIATLGALGGSSLTAPAVAFVDLYFHCSRICRHHHSVHKGKSFTRQ